MELLFNHFKTKIKHYEKNQHAIIIAAYHLSFAQHKMKSPLQEKFLDRLVTQISRN
jgi:hypothetical protein